ncbi:hypothetical protein FKV24_006215 [Lysobacter maris]|uniref:Uncharacterized protein n=1 Tax=Marilutibacter maris TaxID=1605891 RepID=A0A508AVY3_9GAMM|nr:hypothetical protein [Lysobacter maris]KAB8193929.1 hypothetical protein FKV24_006215 [Lysobacter maris]
MWRILHSFALITLLACCSSVPARIPLFESVTPTFVQGRVIELRPQGAWIEFVDSTFVSYDTIVVELFSPMEASGQRVHLQYQGVPLAAGRTIHVGQTVSFTLPVVAGDGCCEPYLEDISDLDVLIGE